MSFGFAFIIALCIWQRKRIWKRFCERNYKSIKAYSYKSNSSKSNKSNKNKKSKNNKESGSNKYSK